jgi:DNA-binding GntR family transcriptional regulator
MDEKPSAAEQAKEVPLTEQLRSVPIDYRTSYAIQWDENGAETGHRFIQVGYMMHRAADAIDAATERAARRCREICQDHYGQFGEYSAHIIAKEFGLD